MPPRLSKRQQREQEEIAALSSTKIINDEVAEKDDAASSNSERATASKVSSKAGFSLLMGNVVDDADADDDESDKAGEPSKSSGKKKNKKKKKKPSSSSANMNAGSAPNLPPVTANTGIDGTISMSTEIAPSLKKDKQSTKKGKKKADQGDDLDRALAELSVKYPDLASTNTSTIGEEATPATVSALQNLRSCLTIQARHLDPDAEMKRFFGSKVINAAESSSSAHGHGGPQPRAPTARSILCRPQPTWPPAGLRDGLTMRPLTREEMQTPYEPMIGTSSWLLMPGDKWFTVEHSPGYRWDQAHFLQIVNMLDPNNLFALMRESYWHIDTLLQIGEVYRAQDDYSVSSDFTSRALFAYEKSFSGAFNLTNGASRLDFRKVENRSLFLALHRTILYLERRGTMRTAFEFAKILWSLDPWTDPQGALLHLDFLAVKADQHQWFREVEEAWDEICIEKKNLLPLDSIPGWKWSKALLLKGLGAKQGGGEKRATEVLKQAILSFPEVLVALAPLIGLTIPSGTNLPTLLTRWTPSDETNSTLWLLAQIYAHRAVSLWKIPETLSWLNKTVQEISKDISTDTGNTSRSRSSLVAHLQGSLWKNNVVRHAIVADIKALAPFLGSILAHFGSQDAYDPFPPQGYGVTRYDETYLSQASADTAKKRQQRQQTGGRRRRGGDGMVDIDPINILETLETILSLEVDADGRGRMLALLQEGQGAAIVRQLERWIRQHPDLAEQFPRSRDYLLMPPDQRPRAPIAQVAVGNGVPEPAANDVIRPAVLPIHRMPGGLVDIDDNDENQQRHPGSDEEGEDEDEDDSENEAQDGAAMLPIRIARGLVNMFWGGRPTNPPESDSEEDEDEDVHDADDP